jgi:hypothetical protein
MREFILGAVITLVVSILCCLAFDRGYKKGYTEGYEYALDTVGGIVKEMATKDSAKVAKVVMPFKKDTLTFYLSNPKKS